MHNSAPSPSDEIDLLQLWQMLWAGKWSIVACSLITLALGALYVFVLATPRYAASIHVDQPPAHTLVQFNQGREPAGLTPYTPALVFEHFTRNLTSDEAFQLFIRHALQVPADTPITTAELEENDWRVSISPPNPRGRNLYKVTVSAHSSAKAQQHLNDFLALVHQQAKTTLVNESKSAVTSLNNNLERQISQQRQIARQQRQDRIAQLREALTVAQAIDQTTPQVNLGRSSSAEALSPYLDGSELYARGARALQAELNVLEAREDDDAFIETLRQDQAQLDLLQNITSEGDGLQLFKIDGEALLPESPVHPKKLLILALALIIGGMLGVFIVLVRGLSRAQRTA